MRDSGLYDRGETPLIDDLPNAFQQEMIIKRVLLSHGISFPNTSFQVLTQSVLIII